jgi:putative membrane protein
MNRITKILCTAVVGCAGSMIAVSAHAAVTDSDKTFLTNAAQGNLDEIKLGELAEQKSTNPQVKAFAHTMIVQHKMLEQKMAPFAQQWSIVPPTTLDSENQQEFDKLSALSGSEFDKEYVSNAVQQHKQTLDAFDQELNTTSDQQFKQAVMKGKSVVAAHLKMAEGLEAKVSK